MNEPSFRAAGLLGNTHVQSYLASAGLRKRKFRRWINDVQQCTVERILTASDGARLQGHFTLNPDARGLAILFHGWEGSVDSTYLLDLSATLWQSGLSIFRLHFRDHGATHHLNEGLFHSCRLDEVVDVVSQVIREYHHLPVFLAGFSLGGNFALRVARNLEHDMDNVKHVFGVCPVIDPQKSLRAIESASWHYEAYFLMKWRGSLKKKKQLFPDQYVNAPLKGLRLEDMTAYLVKEYTEFAKVDDYFAGYAIRGDYLSELAIDATIVACEDDPVIPVEDFHELVLPESTQLIINEQGGHCGMIDQLMGPSWVTRLINDRINQNIRKNRE